MSADTNLERSMLEQPDETSGRYVVAWQEAMHTLSQTLDPQVYSAYLEGLSLERFDQQTAELFISAPSIFHCNHLEKNFSHKIFDIISSSLGDQSVKGLRFSVKESTEEAKSKNARAIPFVVKKPRSSVRQTKESPQQLSLLQGLNPRYTFRNFVVGNSNEFCHAAAMRVAETPGMSYNPLFIYGGVGLGKTHLLHAIGNSALERNPRAKVLYLSSETFTNELIMALRHAKMDEFKKRLRGIEVLLIDDIQFIRGKERTQEEFFHTFNYLYGAKHQIVITSDKLPSEIPGLEERLQTRFAWGLTADLQAPDFETRVAILKRKALSESVTLESDVAELVAERISSNVRELEGALTRLCAMSSLRNIPITRDMAESALKHIFQPRSYTLSINDIKKAVATHFSLKVSDIVSKRRTRNLSFPRHVGMYLCRKHTTASYPEIGLEFGGRDHSSVIHAANVVAGKVAVGGEVKLLIEELERRLFGQAS